MQQQWQTVADMIAAAADLASAAVAIIALIVTGRDGGTPPERPQ